MRLAALLAGGLGVSAAAGAGFGGGGGAAAGVSLAVLGTPRLRKRVEHETLRGLTVSRGTDTDGAPHSL